MKLFNSDDLENFLNIYEKNFPNMNQSQIKDNNIISNNFINKNEYSNPNKENINMNNYFYNNIFPSKENEEKDTTVFQNNNLKNQTQNCNNSINRYLFRDYPKKNDTENFQKINRSVITSSNINQDNDLNNKETNFRAINLKKNSFLTNQSNNSNNNKINLLNKSFSNKLEKNKDALAKIQNRNKILDKGDVLTKGYNFLF